MKISQIISDFHSEYDVAIDYINTAGVAPRLGIGATTLTRATLYRTNLDGSFTTYVNPLTTNGPAIIAVHKDYDKAVKEYRSIQQSVKNNAEITLLPADIAALHIHQDVVPRHHVPAKTFSPNNQIIHQTHLVNRVFVNNPTPGQEDKKHKPEDVGSIGRAIAYVANGSPAPERKQYSTMAPIGAVLFNIISDPEELNMDVYLITWYVSPTGEPGPESRPLKFTVV